jgi:hypothetical protein
MNDPGDEKTAVKRLKEIFKMIPSRT